MDWRFILTYGSLGLPLGVARLLGLLPAALEMPVWLGLAFIWVMAAIRKVPQAAFQHVFVICMLTAFLAGNVQAAFLGTYLVNNPIPLNETGEQVFETPTAPFLVLSYLLLGSIFAVVTGLTAALTVRFTQRTRPPRGPMDPAPLGAPFDLTHPERDRTASGLPLPEERARLAAAGASGDDEEIWEEAPPRDKAADAGDDEESGAEAPAKDNGGDDEASGDEDESGDDAPDRDEAGEDDEDATPERVGRGDAADDEGSKGQDEGTGGRGA